MDDSNHTSVDHITSGIGVQNVESTNDHLSHLGDFFFKYLNMTPNPVYMVIGSYMYYKNPFQYITMVLKVLGTCQIPLSYESQTTNPTYYTKVIWV